MVTTPFRTTPNLGPELHQTGKDYYWDSLNPDAEPSYQLGTKMAGNDGHLYVHVTAAAALAAGAGVTINEGTWVATGAATGSTHTAPVAVAAGDAFQARQNTL